MNSKLDYLKKYRVSDSVTNSDKKRTNKKHVSSTKKVVKIIDNDDIDIPIGTTYKRSRSDLDYSYAETDG